MPARVSSWPTALGVLAIVIGSLGIIAYGCGGTFGLLTQSAMYRAMKSTGAGTADIFDAQAQVTTKYMPFTIANGVILSGLAILILIAGVGMLRRRTWSRRCALTWAVLRIVYAVPAAYLSYRLTQEMMQAMTNAMATTPNPSGGTMTMPAGMSSIMQIFGVVGVVITFFFTCAMPIFALVWFNLPQFKREMAGWGATASGRLPESGRGD